MATAAISISSVGALYAAAAALGITVAGLTIAEVAQEVKRKAGDKYNIDWNALESQGEVSEFSAAKTHENATARLDQGERDRLNNIANSEAGGVKVPKQGTATTVTKEPNSNGNNNDEKKGPIEPGFISSLSNSNIEDKTNENIEQTIGTSMTTTDYMKWAEEQQRKQWEREDAIRGHIEAREDTAWSRSLADLRKAGVNPAAMGSFGAAPSGGGITQATGIQSNTITESMSSEIKKFIESISQNFEGSENEKDRMQGVIGAIITAAALYFMRSGGK